LTDRNTFIEDFMHMKITRIAVTWLTQLKPTKKNSHKKQPARVV